MRSFNPFFIIFLLLAAISTAPSCKTEAGHNKYHEAKVRPSQQEARENKRILDRGNKAYKKQMRSNRKHLFGRATAPH